MTDTLILLPERHRHLIRSTMKHLLHEREGDLDFCNDMITMHWNCSNKDKPESARAFKNLNHYKDYKRKLRKELTTIRSILQVMK